MNKILAGLYQFENKKIDQLSLAGKGRREVANYKTNFFPSFSSFPAKPNLK
jgi:hypothetical protein